MRIVYKNRTLEKQCTVARETQKRFGDTMAVKIHQRIAEISAADSIETLIKSGIGKCHKLKGKRKNQYAMHLEQPYRLIFEVFDSEIHVVKIIEIVDYH